jgi:hypothetical protein
MTDVKTATHKLAITRETLPAREQRIDDVYPGLFQGNPRGAGSKGLEALDDAARALFVGDARVAKRFFGVAVECLSAGARSMTAGIGVEIDFEIDGYEYRGAADQPSDLASPARYLRALTSVIALRASNVADDLVAVPMAQIERAAGRNPAYLKYVAAWRACWQRSDARALVQQTAKLFDAQTLGGENPKSAACSSSNVAVMQALLDEDATRLDAALVVALKAHKAWWGAGARLNDPVGILASQSAALASLAVQRGMTVTTGSGYMPRWLIEGRDPE